MRSFEKSSYTDITKYKAQRKRERILWQNKLKIYLNSQKKPCLFCNSTENIEFHHANPIQKEYNVTSLIKFSRKKIDEELLKCWCLCSSCHQKLHQRVCDPLPICYEMDNQSLSVDP